MANSNEEKNSGWQEILQNHKNALIIGGIIVVGIIIGIIVLAMFTDVFNGDVEEPVSTPAVADTETPTPTPTPPPTPQQEATLENSVNVSSDYLIISLNWQNGTTTAFIRDKDNPVWVIRGRAGQSRISHPTFEFLSDRITINFPTTQATYYLFDDGTGIFGDESFMWSFQTDDVTSLDRVTATNQTTDLVFAIEEYSMISVYINWYDFDYPTLLYMDDDGVWWLRSRDGVSFSPQDLEFEQMSWGTLMTFNDFVYRLYDDGTGEFGVANAPAADDDDTDTPDDDDEDDDEDYDEADGDDYDDGEEDGDDTVRDTTGRQLFSWHFTYTN